MRAMVDPEQFKTHLTELSDDEVVLPSSGHLSEADARVTPATAAMFVLQEVTRKLNVMAQSNPDDVKLNYLCVLFRSFCMDIVRSGQNNQVGFTSRVCTVSRKKCSNEFRFLLTNATGSIVPARFY